MDTIYRGRLESPGGRARAWIDCLFIDHGILRLFWTNFATVAPGRLYRSNHPLPVNLRAAARRHGIRTLINLRGRCENGSDALSREAAAQLGLAFHDMALESRGAPHKDRVLRLAEIYRTMQAPALVHCKSGADRAGLAAGIFLLGEGASAAQALDQLSLRYGHVRQARTGILDAFFLRYRNEAEGRKPFLDWVRDEYDETALRRDFRAHGLADFLVDRVMARE